VSANVRLPLPTAATIRWGTRRILTKNMRNKKSKHLTPSKAEQQRVLNGARLPNKGGKFESWHNRQMRRVQSCCQPCAVHGSRGVSALVSDRCPLIGKNEFVWWNRFSEVCSVCTLPRSDKHVPARQTPLACRQNSLQQLSVALGKRWKK